MMMGLSFRQWMIVIARAPVIVEKVKAILPELLPIIDDVRDLAHELGLAKPGEKKVTPKQIIERGLEDLTPEERALFNRMTGRE